MSYIAMSLGVLSLCAAYLFSPGYKASNDLYPVNVAYNMGHAAGVAPTWPITPIPRPVTPSTLG